MNTDREHSTDAEPALHPPCWCNTPKAKWGCRVFGHGPKPLPANGWARCRTCTAVTKNLRPRICDACVVLFDAMEDQVNTGPVYWLLKRLWLREVSQ